VWNKEVKKKHLIPNTSYRKRNAEHDIQVKYNTGRLTLLSSERRNIIPVLAEQSEISLTVPHELPCPSVPELVLEKELQSLVQLLFQLSVAWPEVVPGDEAT
jgi:hypothetical protein